MTSFQACPDPSVLAAYAEGRLEGSERRRVEEHVADCPECPVVLGETVRFLREQEPNSDPMTGGSWWRVAAAVAIVALCVPTVWWIATKRDPLSRTRAIAASMPTRPVEGRLDSFDHAAFATARSGGAGSLETIAFRAEAERLRDERAPHARGVALLLAGDAASARRVLAAAARAEPRNAVLWNDLTVACIAAGHDGHRTDFEQAIAAADRAISLAPSLAAPHFNRAIALEHLGRLTEAANAYRRAVVLDPRSRWSEEAASRIHRLTR